MVKRIELKCLECGISHFKLKCQLGRGRGKFCSKDCANKHRQHGKTIKCVLCGNEFYRRFGEQKNYIKRFCSKECYTNERILNAKKTTYLKTGAKHIHIIVAEKALKRPLLKGEVVHHIDEDKHNNNIDNLAVLPSQQIHAKVHFGKYNFDKYKLINLIK
jgi:hypothetical protein